MNEQKAAVVMAETFRLEGVPNYIQRTEEATGIPARKLRSWIKSYRDGSLDLGEGELVSFLEGEWSTAKRELAFLATQANRRILNHIHDMLDVDTVASLITSGIKDMAQTLQILSREGSALMGEQRAPSGVAAAGVASTVNIVLPPKGEMPIKNGEIEVTSTTATTEGDKDAS